MREDGAKNKAPCMSATRAQWDGNDGLSAAGGEAGHKTDALCCPQFHFLSIYNSRRNPAHLPSVTDGWCSLARAFSAGACAGSRARARARTTRCARRDRDGKDHKR